MAKFKITKDTPIIEITERFPDIADYLVQEFEFHCIGCPLAYEETIEQGAIVHGLEDQEIKNLIKKLNSMIK